MGVVYLAEHPVIGRKVALKAIHPELSRNPEVVSRFMTEAKSVNQIGNEHIVDVSDFGTTTDGEFYFIMEYLQGESLADRLRRERLFDPHRALQIAAQVADALAASHSHGIIHRDLKPENIFLITRGQNRDFVKVLDFGLAKLTQGEEKVTHKTRTGSVMGTPYYMAPEQCEGKAERRPPRRHLLAGRDPVRDDDRPGAVRRRGLRRDHRQAHDPAAARAARLQPDHHPRPGGGGDARAGQGARGPLPHHGGVPRGDAGSRRATCSESAGPARAHRDRDARPTRAAVASRHGDGGRRPARAGGCPMPSTFGHGAGEVDDEFAPPRSRKGLVVGALLAAAVAAGAAVFYVKRQSASQTPPAAVATPGPGFADHGRPHRRVPPVAPAAPEKVTISFSSLPSGAVVTVKDTGEVLGTTPFDKDMPSSETPLAVVFKKPGYEEAEQPLVPKSSGPLNASLRPTPRPRRGRAALGRQAAASPPAARRAARPSGTKDRTKPAGTGRRRRRTARHRRRRADARLPEEVTANGVDPGASRR